MRIVLASYYSLAILTCLACVGGAEGRLQRMPARQQMSINRWMLPPFEWSSQD